MTRPVIIFDYDSQWPVIYEEEKQRILTVGGDKVLCVEHIGSTSVVGLGAKPIIDMMVGVDGLVSSNDLLPMLRIIGYDDVTPEPDDPDWFYCLSKVYTGEKVRLQNFHIHLIMFGSKTWERHILFRDFLRTNPGAARKYDRLKREMAARYSSDREAYTNSKTQFITSIVIQACKDQGRG